MVFTQTTEGVERNQNQGRGSGNQVLAQAGHCIGRARTELQHANAARLSLHSSWRTFWWSRYPSGKPIPNSFSSRRQPCPKSGSSPCSIRDCSYQSCSFKISSSEVGPVRSTRHHDGQRRRGGVQRIEGGCQLKRAENHRQPPAPGGEPQNIERNADEMMLAEQQANKRQRIDPPAPAHGGATSGDGMCLFPRPDLCDFKVRNPVAACCRHFAGKPQYPPQVEPFHCT